MYQQINMYQPVFRRQHKIFSAATLLKIIAVAAVLLLGVYAQTRWTLHGLQRTSEQLALSYRLLDTRLGSLEASGTSAATASSRNEIERLKEQISAQEGLLERIDHLAIDTAGGFGEVFETLARQNLPGLWLTGIQLDQHGDIEIRGTTLDPKLVPRYLQLMGEKPRLAVLNNGSVNLTRHAPDKPEIDFILSYNAQGTMH
jgi:Tfp pilus assembly protein PilN